MSKNLRLKILKYIKSNGGEYETVNFAPIITKSVKKVDRKNVKAVLKDLKNEGYIDAEWKGLSFLNNVDGTMKSENDIYAIGKINQKGISYLLEHNLKSKQIIHTFISTISIILTFLFTLYGLFIKCEISKLNDNNKNLEKRILELEKKSQSENKNNF